MTDRAKGTGYADPIVGYYVSGPDGRQDFFTRSDAQAAYDALEGQPRAIGRWRQRTSIVPRLVNDMVIQGRQRSRYGDLIERDGDA